MTRRTLTLLIVFVAVSVGAALQYLRQDATSPRAAVARADATAARPAAQTREVPRHPRIADDAKILAPFGSRLGRMVDDFDKAMGIDVHVVTSVDATTPIETQAVEGFRNRWRATRRPAGC